jgi:hypothetical protein
MPTEPIQEPLSKLLKDPIASPKSPLELKKAVLCPQTKPKKELFSNRTLILNPQLLALKLEERALLLQIKSFV